MTMTLGGGWWLIIVLVVVGVLFAIALSRRDNKSSQKDKIKPVAPPTADIVKLDQLLNRHLPNVTTTVKHNRILVQDGQNQRLMLTMDKKLKAGSRQLGEAMVINFHKLPNAEVLKQTVQASLKSS